MASRNDPKSTGQNKLATYGKAARKPLHRAPLPVRSVDAARIDSTGDVFDFMGDDDDQIQGLTSSYSVAKVRDDVTGKKRKRQKLSFEDTNHGAKMSQKTNAPTKAIKPPRRPVTVTSGLATSESSVSQKTYSKNADTKTTLTATMRRTQNHDSFTPSTSSASLATSDYQHRPAESAKRPQRLIDTLVAQRPQSPDSDLAIDEPDHSSSSSRASSIVPSQPIKSLSTPKLRLKARPGASSQSGRVKLTYGQTRTIRTQPEDGNANTAGSQEEQLDALLSTGPSMISPDPFAMCADDGDDDDEGAGSQIAIKSVHELRRAGANNRFSDEMEDILVRVGAPGVAQVLTRRNALLELAQKLQRKDFISQFRDHAARDKIAQDIHLENDLMSGFALAAIFVTFLNFSPAAHLLRQLTESGIEDLLRKLLEVQADIVTIASEGKYKIPRSAKTTLGLVKTSLIQQDIWHGYKLEELSPRTIALQLLALLCLRTNLEDSHEVVQSLGSDLSMVMDGYTSTNSDPDADFALLACILETQSSLAPDSIEDPPWILQEAPKVARLLCNALKKWPETMSDDVPTMLKLSINMTNTAEGASAFNDLMVLASLSGCINNGFATVQDHERRLRNESYDGLLLILGVTINIVEHCPAARESINETSMRSLMALYLKDRVPTSEVDSVDKSRLSVAFGYLAVLLGYLSLSMPARKALVAITDGNGLTELISSIREFIGMYKSVDNRVHELEGLVHGLEQTSV